jgi:hypothetical protein
MTASIQPRKAAATPRARPVHVESLHDIDSLADSIKSGRVILEAVAYPWGVEFDLVEVEEPK